MGIISGALRRGIGEAAGFGAEVAMTSAKSSIEEARQTRLAELQNQFQVARDERQEGYAVGRETRVEDRAAARETRQETRADTRQQAGFTHTETMQRATHRLQRDLAESHERAANTRHGQSIGIQLAQLRATQEQVTLIPQVDGTFQKVRKDGTVVGTLTDLAGNPVQGPKDVAASAKILVEGNTKIMAALAKDLSDAPPDSPQRKALQDQITGLQNENKRLLGVATPAAATAQPSAADIAGLRERANNPAAVAHFEGKFGPGSAQAHLNPPAQGARPGSRGIISSRTPGLAQVIDEQRPYQPRPAAELDEEDRMPAP